MPILVNFLTNTVICISWDGFIFAPGAFQEQAKDVIKILKNVEALHVKAGKKDAWEQNFI